MKQFLLILRDQEVRWDQFSPEELKGVLDLYTEWNRRLRERDQFRGAGKLTSNLGGTVRARDGELVVDGPFSEAKEAIAGYYCVNAETFDEAAAAAKECPILTYGGSVEVREMVGPPSTG